MIKAIIIDDEPLARAVVKEYLASYTQITLLQECGDGFEGLKAIQQHQPDLLFLDVQMPKINGFEMLELVEHLPSVIFTTAFEEHAIRAFEVNAVDYLLKPFSKERFDKALQKWIGTSESVRNLATAQVIAVAGTSPLQSNRIVVKLNGKIKIIPVQDVYYLEAADDYVKVVTEEGAFLKNKTMSFFEQLLDMAQFARVHRSYILNVNQVTRIEPYEKENHLAILKSGAKIPVSKTGYPKLKAALGL
ncbi:two component transcriptional regulator, LytTR family [Chitinophaga costaii]|uniref:Two component transcriptional regulator, LytTR family n=1 Tax=Chitinophaga costaii TaxID=1335309 RepID=A0A1C4DAW1_9BACT|nr:LytTR family transcriptional regulator DNA-binding domain-containing protein [Chitinophaga costaii]PUZ24537.1 DNA-binding response regulator [Chitinophaga costaii]SCC28436.1 two component transcriptional regulator, LytTR family [Chitinophaga costaii]